MKVYVFGFVFFCLFCVGDAFADDAVPNDMQKPVDTVAIQYDSQEMLRQMVTRIKPAAGVVVHEEDESVRQTRTTVPYWKQKVLRNRRRALSE